MPRRRAGRPPQPTHPRPARTRLSRQSIEAHLSIVVAAMAVSHYIEAQTLWSTRKFVRTTRRYRTVIIKAGNQTLTAADPLPDDLREAHIKIRADGAH